MSIYDDTLLAARFAALTPEPLPGDWDDVRTRAGGARGGSGRFAEWLQSRRRRPLVALLTAVVLIAVLGTASAFAVRAILSAGGIVGLAPAGATPSAPEKGELVLDFAFGHTPGDPGRFHASVYADGRFIWQRLGDESRVDEHRRSTGVLERRLTPEGVELVRNEVLSTGLVDHDLVLHASEAEGLYFGYIDYRTPGRRVRVVWGDDLRLLDVGPEVPRTAPTPEQTRALLRLDERLEDPESWLPASAWEDPLDRAFVPSGYSVCYQGAKGVELSRLLALLPPAADRLLRAQENMRQQGTNLLGTFVSWCSELTNEEARALRRILDGAGIRGRETVFGLEYGPPDFAYLGQTEFILGFSPNLPDRG